MGPKKKSVATGKGEIDTKEITNTLSTFLYLNWWVLLEEIQQLCNSQMKICDL